MTTTIEPHYYRVRNQHREELMDKTPESEIMVSWSDYKAAVAQQQQCAGLTAAEWRKLWVTTVEQATEARSQRDTAKFENEMLLVAIEALKAATADGETERG